MDQERGLAALEKVAREVAGRATTRIGLILLYTREKRFPEVLTLARELSAKYTRNYLFRLEAAVCACCSSCVGETNKNFAAAEKAEQELSPVLNDLLRDRSVRETVSRALDLVHFKYGEVADCRARRTGGA